MLKRLFLISLLLLLYAGVVYAQYSCITIRLCKEDSVEHNSILSIKQYNIKNLPGKEVEHSEYGEPYSTVTIYEYDKDYNLSSVIDSNAFVKTVKNYFYTQGRIEQLQCITSTLSTENVMRRYDSSLLEDSILSNRPNIVYVRLIDTIIHHYYYNNKGLLIKISKQSKEELFETTETFEYDTKNRLAKSTVSDQYLYKYHYDTMSRLVKKEKYNNTYVDDSGIGPYFKPESERLRKAIWSLSSSKIILYDELGRMIERVEQDMITQIIIIKEKYQYDREGRIIELITHEKVNDTDSPSCRTVYRYE